ncbi:MAG: sensor domain-containing protein [Vulcanimicrobiaceae bacterium]
MDPSSGDEWFADQASAVPPPVAFRPGLIGPVSSVTRGELEKFVALVELSSDFIAMAGLDATVEYVNAAGRKLVGLEATEDVTRYTIADFLTEEGLRQSEAIEQPAVRERGSWQGESGLRHFQTGESIPVTINSYLVVHPDTREPLGLATVQRDIRQHKKIERELLETNLALRRHALAHEVISELAEFALVATVEALYQRTVSEIGRALGAKEVTIFAPTASGGLSAVASSVTDANAERLTRTALAADVLLRSESILASDGDECVIGVLIPGRSESLGVLEVAAREKFDEDQKTCLETIAGLLAAAAQRQQAEDALHFEALHDPLTKLPNRALMLDRLARALERNARSSQHVAVFLVDIDHFKVVNDSLGHVAGDHLLLEFSRRLCAVMRPADTVARLGGDEFVIICEDVASEVEAFAFGERLKNVWEQPFQIGAHSTFIEASTGVTLKKADKSTTPQEMLLEADTAMYRAKRRRIGGVEIYDAAMKEATLKRLNLSSELHHALRSGQVFPVYQPIVSLSTGRCVAIEALARWRRDDSMVPPKEFIALAEDSGLIIPLGVHILKSACETVLGWMRRHPDEERIGLRVNVSGRQVIGPSFVPDIQRIIAGTGFPPELLGLEVTEAVLIEEQDIAQQRFEQLQSLGISILLDDFGTGYSSMLYLRGFTSLRFLKIDQSFVQGIVQTPTDAAIVRTIANLGHAFGLGVIAEGVETREQADKAVELGCDYAQGYYFSRPLKAELAEAYLFG